VNAAVRPVFDDLLIQGSVRHRPSSVIALALMTGVRAAHGVAPVQRLRHGRVRQLSIEGPETEPLKTPVPVLERHPRLEVDCGLDNAGDATERSMNLHRCRKPNALLGAGHGVFAVHMNRFGMCDPRLRQGQRRDRRASLVETACCLSERGLGDERRRHEDETDASESFT
jgi:hypothetical protein